MHFNDHIKQIIDRDIALKDQIQAEEAPKNAFFLTFLQISGYDVFSPTEVMPGFISDIGLKKGEKIGYAILELVNLLLVLNANIGQKTKTFKG